MRTKPSRGYATKERLTNAPSLASIKAETIDDQ